MLKPGIHIIDVKQCLLANRKHALEKQENNMNKLEYYQAIYDFCDMMLDEYFKPEEK